MQVGILPTDTFPAFVCDLDNRDAVQRLYQIKGIPPSQPLSILCASFRDISEYTQVTISIEPPRWRKLLAQYLCPHTATASSACCSIHVASCPHALSVHRQTPT